MSSPTPSLRRRSSLKDYFSSQIPRLPSLRSRRSTLSINSTHSRENSSGYAPYAVHQQNMAPIILRDPEATQKLLEYIFDSPGGRRSLARLARTCKAFKEPALDMLWRDLDSFVPLITLFPNTLLKRARRPALGLARSPEEEDWEKVLAYGERVKSVTYVEAFNTLSQSIFPVLEMCPREYLLPNLTSLTWKAETATGLNYCRPYLTSKLRTFTLEMGVRAPRIGDFLDEVMNKTQLTTFCFTLHSNLPENFVTVMKSNERFEKLAVMAPGALASGVGLWASRLPSLKSLSLDLSNASNLAVTRFFDDIQFASGYSTPSRTDSGVFSASDSDSDDKRKSVVRSPSGRILERPFYGAFPSLSQINLTGDAANVVAFLQKLASPLTHIELALEDPPARDDWQTLCMLFSERYGQTLQVLRITAASASRFAELVRSTSRGANDVALRHLPLHHLSPLPRLHRLEIELPESAVFYNADVAHLARVCPNLEVVRLCGQARFPASYGPPPLTLEGLIPLTSGCTKLHTLAVVVHALDGADETFRVRENSSRALLKLNVGHSWVRDPLQTAILISHIAPHLEILRWFTPTGRSGVVEQHAVAWQKVQDYLPAIQKMRLIERSLMPKPVVIVPPKKKDKEVDATVCNSSVGVSAVPVYFDQPMQAEPPEMVDVEVEVVPEFASVEIDATPAFCDEGIDAMPELTEEAIQADDPPEEELEVERAESVTSETSTATHSSLPPILTAFVPSIGGITSLPLRAVRAYTYYISLPFRYVFSFAPMPALVNYATMNEEPKSPSSPVANGEDDDISEKHMHHMNPSTSAADENSMLDSTKELRDSRTAIHVSSPSPPPTVVVRERIFYFDEPPRLPNWAATRKNPAHVVATQIGETPIVRATRQSLKSSQDALLPPPNSNSWYTRPITLRIQDMAEPKKQEKDFTAEVDTLIPVARSLAEAGKLQDAVDKLLVLEKQTRNAADLASTTRLVKETTQICYDARNYDLLNANVLLLSKKHGQLKAVIQAMVEQVMAWLEEIKEREGTEKWLQLIETLRTVTDGKIFLETPRARVTLLLAHHHELLASSPTPTSPSPKESRQTASDLLGELQVETYSSMERREKTEFLLEQMRLLILVAREKDAEKGIEGKSDAIGGGDADWVKVRVAGRKVNETFLTQEGNEEFKLKFYELMIQYALHNSEYLDVARHYHKIWETPSIKADETGRGKEALEHIIYYVVLAPHDNEQSDMLHRVFNYPALSKLELHYSLVKCFTTPELMRWPGIENVYGAHLRANSVFSSDKLWEDLHTRVIEHNIRIVALYYNRISLTRLTSLLDLTPQQTEETLCRLVVSSTIWARIDRPTGIVNFRQARTAEEVMNDWSSDMSKLLGLVEKTWMGVNAAQAAQSRIKA